MRSNRASKTGIQLKMFRKQLTKQFRGLSIIHTVEQCEGSNFSSGSQWLNLVRDEVILRKVNDPDSTPLDSIQLWQWGRSSTKPCRAGIFHLWSDDGLVDHCSLSGKQIWGNSTKKTFAFTCCNFQWCGENHIMRFIVNIGWFWLFFFVYLILSIYADS